MAATSPPRSGWSSSGARSSASTTQFFLNMEIERYTLATGETALTGFNRFWQHWGLVFAVTGLLRQPVAGLGDELGDLPTLHVRRQADADRDRHRCSSIGAVADPGAGRLRRARAAACSSRSRRSSSLIVIASCSRSRADAWRALPQVVTGVGSFPSELGFALLLGALAFAGAGGGQNLCQSNWIRDKGFGMGRYVPRLVSPVTGEQEAAPTATGYIFEPTPANMARWQRWWSFANIEQALTFVLDHVRDDLLHLDAGATRRSSADAGPAEQHRLPPDRGRAAAERSSARWFGVLFWVIGAFSLFAAAMGIVDYTSRLAADVLKTTYLRTSTRPRAGSTSGWSGAWSRSACVDPAGRLRPAAGAAGDLGVHRRA